MVDEIINIFGDIVHIYDNFTSFEGMNIVNSIDGYDFKQRYLEVSKEKYSGSHDKINPKDINLLSSEIRTIVRYSCILAFDGFSKNWEDETYNNASDILSKIEINPQDEEVSDLINTFIRQIEGYRDRFFVMQSSYLKKELEEIPPYKLQKYVEPLEKIKNLQQRIWEMQTGNRIGILSIKVNKCKQ